MAEVASAYVSLIPSYRGGTSQIAKQIAPAAEEAGKESGKKLGAGMLATFAGLGLGASVAALFSKGLQVNQNRNLLAAKLGLNPQDAKTAATVAGKLYAGGFSDNLDDINDAIATVSQNLGGVGNGKQLQGLTGQALSLSKAFGTDVAGNVNAASQLIRTGLAKNAQQAFDIIATGEQNGADKAGDLLDTFNEYGTQFRKLGLDGPKALGLIQQGLQGGARDSDIVADAIKEFSITAVDGTAKTARSFTALGLSAHGITTAIARGGPGASAALESVLNGLRGVQDPAKRSQLAVNLFGTQAEDLGAALFKLNPATALAAKGMGNIDGASKRVTSAMSSTTPPLDALKLKLGGVATTVASDLIPVITPMLALVTKLGAPLVYAAVGAAGLFGAIKAGGAVKDFASALPGRLDTIRRGTLTAGDAVTKFGRASLSAGKSVATATIATVRSGAATVANTARLIASKTATLAMSIATRTYAAAQYVLNAALSANPIALVVIAIVALIAAFVIAYKKSETFRRIVTAAFNGVKAAGLVVARFFTQTLPAAFFAIVNGLKRAFSAAVGFMKTWGPVALAVLVPFIGIPLLIFRHFSEIRGYLGRAFSAALQTARGFVSDVGQTIASLPGRLLNVAGRMLNAGATLMRSLLNGIRGGLSSVGSFVGNLGVSIVNSIVSAINGALHLPLVLPRINTHIPGVGTIGGETILPAIPHLAKGGIVPATPGGQIVRVAEAGQAEAVIPLPRGTKDLFGQRGPVVAGDLIVNQVDDPVGTARAVARRLAHLGAV